jgi:hypothetical protein
MAGSVFRGKRSRRYSRNMFFRAENKPPLVSHQV